MIKFCVRKSPPAPLFALEQADHTAYGVCGNYLCDHAVHCLQPQTDDGESMTCFIAWYKVNRIYAWWNYCLVTQ